jgi:predicted protein tyrosine phosphatase
MRPRIGKNHLAILNNKCQGNSQRILCVCSAGVLRSPTAAWVLSNSPFNFNTRSCGTSELALIPLTRELLIWADEIVCMEEEHALAVNEMMTKEVLVAYEDTWPLVHILHIPDEYDFRENTLVAIMNRQFQEIFGVTTDTQGE